MRFRYLDLANDQTTEINTDYGIANGSILKTQLSFHLCGLTSK